MTSAIGSTNLNTITQASNALLSSTSSSSAAGSGSSATAPAGALDSQQTFLQLLIAQMNNQDPLNPMDSSQMTSQLAQISTVQGIQGLSTELSSILSSLNNAQPLQDASLVGKTVLVPGSTLALQPGGALGGINLSGSADTVTVQIKNASGGVINTLQLGAQQAGIVDFAWDGTTSSGAQAASGPYSFSVAATSGGTSIPAGALSAGQVTGVTPGTNGTSLNVSGIGTFNVNQVQQIL